ncbi:hypothetical protein [Arthrobacter glacialis]|uniref:Uncharacterized protein n=1 Tax=Arthrobacter glacialis TaxID=1664 RepID=A0A2S3ZWA7_ARTGL|nr:hypothetical protein [Arthrobacter glacialis]POH73463.1 hypothetical protein CVS27_11185 [Arthrobacter glacialis]
MASQATEHLDVYAYLNRETNRSPGFKVQTNDPVGAIELLLDVRDSMKSALNQLQVYEDSFLTDAQRRSPSWMNLSALARKAPPIWRSISAIVFIDDFDALCREWTRGGSRYSHPHGPSGMVEELARDGATAGIGVVVAGRSLARTTIPYVSREGSLPTSTLLLGPSTLAERESFLSTDVASLEAGQGSGLYEAWGSDAAEVVQVDNARTGEVHAPPIE